MGRAAGSDDAEGGDAVTQALITGAAQRLALARWEQARDGGNGKALSDLPLFALP